MSTKRERAKAQMKQNVTVVATADTKKEKNEVLYELGKYCYDLSKLAFGGVVLSNVIHFESENTAEFVVSILIMLALLVSGTILVKQGTKR